MEDLIQVGSIGLIKAVDRFDLDRGGAIHIRYAHHHGRDKAVFPRQGVGGEGPACLQDLSVRLNRVIEAAHGGTVPLADHRGVGRGHGSE